MPSATKAFVLKNVSLTLVEADAAGTAVAYECQLSKAIITPSAGSTTSYTTFCAKFDDIAEESSYTLDLSGFQAYQDVADLTVILWEEAGKVYDFVLQPNLGQAAGSAISATNYAFSGQVTLVEAPIGGTVNEWATFDVSLPCVTKPTMLLAPPVPLSAGKKSADSAA